MNLIVEPIMELRYNDNNCWGLYACNVIEGEQVQLNNYGNVTISGTMPRLEMYNQYEIEVKEKIHKKWGKQYEFVSMKLNKPKTKGEQRQFLSRILTELQVDNICKVYDFPVDEILNGTFDYEKVKGIGLKTYKSIERRIAENFIYFELLSELGQYGITFNQIKQLHDKYKDPQVALERVKANPYILYQEIKGVGFKRADNIALKMNMSPTDDKRVIACVQYILEQNEQDGNTYVTDTQLMAKLTELIPTLEIKTDNIINLISENQSFLVLDGGRICLRHTYNTEYHIVQELKRIAAKEEKFNLEKFIEQQERRQGFKYNELQKKPFYDILEHNVIVITGYAGTGKSTVLNGLCNMFDEFNWDIWQFALSGKAADVIREYTGREASTIHKGLGWSSEGYAYNKKNPLEYKVYIIDECSMVNIFLFRDLLEALPNGCKLIIVGDTGQLQSIGAGSVLNDIIESNMFPVTQLTEVYRQALESGILDLATRIRNGECFLKDDDNGCYNVGVKKDVKLICGTRDNTVNYIIKSYNYLLKKYKPEDIVVLVPRKDIECGTKNLNGLIQDIVNPLTDNTMILNKFRENDIVINVTNNYEAMLTDEKTGEVFNGEIGVINYIANDHLTVDFKDKSIIYEFETLNNLELAYSLTIHKSQGSQFKAVIIGIDSTHWYQATRNLLYTAFTRASEMLIVCCDPKTVNYAISNNPIKNKQTFLQGLLEEVKYRNE